MDEKESTSKGNTAGGLVFVGCMMTGIGIGIYFNQTAVGTMVGLGIGFIGFGIIKLLVKN